MTEAMAEAAADAFAVELVRWRAERGLSKKELAAELGFDPSYVSHVEARRHRPTEDFARRAETVLRAGGMIWQRFREYTEVRAVPSVPRPRPEPVVAIATSPVAGLVVEHDDASLSYEDGVYRCRVRRDLFNGGTDPVRRYLVRVSVDRYPGEPERSNRHYREHPLTWAELGLTARRGDEPMTWQAKEDRDTLKEVWLLFENDAGRFPLYPQERATIEYSFTVGEEKWGPWFQRAVRLPTRRLSVHLDFPAHLRPVVWGVETSHTADAGTLKTPVVEGRSGDRVRFDWTMHNPALGARYRLEWRLRASPVEPARPRAPERARPSEIMRGAGIVQRGAPLLDRASRRFDLPRQASLAQEVTASLLDALSRVERVHAFTKGVGLSAPQIGIDWAAAVVREPGAEPTVLLNPRIIGESVERDDQYEGCVSFFDQRGLVSRPLLVEVEHDRPDGGRTTTAFARAAARLASHEIDHLSGFLYTDRMPAEQELIAVEDYAEQGRPWVYP